MSTDLQSGKVLRIHEIVNRGSSLDGQAVRTIGKLVQYNAATSTAVLSTNDGTKLTISTRLLDPFPYHLHSLIQVIGEVELSAPGKELFIVPRVARCVDGLDLRLYDEALGVWRQFLEQQGQAQEQDELPSDIFDM